MKSQLDRIKLKLERDGYVTRNQCLSTFPAITRLGARIADLKAEGYVFETTFEHGDYIYKLIKEPQPKQLSLV